MKIISNERSHVAPTYFARENDYSNAQAQLTAHPGRELGTVIYTLAVSALALGADGYELPSDMDDDERAALMRAALDIALDAEARVKDLVESFLAQRGKDDDKEVER